MTFQIEIFRKVHFLLLQERNRIEALPAWRDGPVIKAMFEVIKGTIYIICLKFWLLILSYCVRRVWFATVGV